jgi:hypothetical protein
MYNVSLPKVDGVSNQPAAEMNSVFNELITAVTSASQTLSNVATNQLAKSLAIYAAGGDFYEDSGTADNYVLSVVGSKLAPIAYFDGMRVRFLPGNANTGASSVNVATLGAIDIKKADGVTDTVADDLPADRLCELTYNDALSVFTLNDTSEITSYSSTSFGYLFFENIGFVWGTAVAGVVVLPQAFNNNILQVLASDSGNVCLAYGTDTFTATGFTLYGAGGARYLAIGY